MYKKRKIDFKKFLGKPSTEDLETLPGEYILPPSAFISVWRTTVNNVAITLPYISGIQNYGIIYWGDGETSDNSYDSRTHIYSLPGTYTITIVGTVQGFNFYDSSTDDKDKIVEIIQWGNLTLGKNTFVNCTNLQLNNVRDIPNLTNVTTLENFFYNCQSLTTIKNINSWDVSNVTNMKNMFQRTRFNQNISDWDVSNVTNMRGMFFLAIEFNQNISNWNVSGVTDMYSMFRNALKFNQNLSSWCVEKIENPPLFFDAGASSWTGAPATRPQWGSCPS